MRWPQAPTMDEISPHATVGPIRARKNYDKKMGVDAQAKKEKIERPLQPSMVHTVGAVAGLSDDLITNRLRARS